MVPSLDLFTINAGFDRVDVVNDDIIVYHS